MAVSPTQTSRNKTTGIGGLIVLAVILVHYLLYPDMAGRLAFSVIAALLFLMPRAVLQIVVRPRTAMDMSDARVVVNAAWICCLCGVMMTMLVTPSGTWAVTALQGALLGHLTWCCGATKQKLKERQARYKASK